MYGSIDRQNGEIRIRESVEKEISISSCRNGYAAVNRLVAPSPHKYSIKFIRTNISSAAREKSYHDLRPRFIPGDWFRLQPSPISPSPNPRFPIVQTRYVSIYESTPYTHPIQIPLEESKIATSWSPTDTASGRANINSSIEFTSNRYLVFLVHESSFINFKNSNLLETRECRDIAYNFQRWWELSTKISSIEIRISHSIFFPLLSASRISAPLCVLFLRVNETWAASLRAASFDHGDVNWNTREIVETSRRRGFD